MANTTVHARETACTFGTDCQLTGVFTEASGEHHEQACALFLTAGLLHHIGPTRLHVELARSLAAQGVAGLRFDLSGAGDSEPSSLGGDYRQRPVREVTQAMDYLQAHHGKQRFVLLGLCSGADDALATAQQDPRVVGVVLLNGYAYPAGRFRFYRILRFYMPRLFVWQKLRNGAGRLLRRLLPRQPAATAVSTSSASVDVETLTDQERLELLQLDNDYRHIPPQAETAAILQSLCQADTDLLFIYTGSEHDTYTYEGQLGAMFPDLRDDPHLQERYIQEADHTLILKEDRDKVIAWISEWFRQAMFTRHRL
ncbi:alpha/beta fold hydrolase [Granulosicoccus sp. 3-233]|uniref:alpha/beta fold hydrolase n=1 Tax=Granulosicoccus sp. 3-233 TaxID=3417969 RepID=UPI003D32DEC5